MTNATVMIEQELERVFPGRVQHKVPLAPFTTLRIGGPAEFLLETDSVQDVIEARRLCQRTGIPFTYLSGGSNVLIDDGGLRGVTVVCSAATIVWNDSARTVVVGAGYDLDPFVADVSRRGWADLSFAAGIPGSLGGALAGGAGAFGHLVHEYLIDALVLLPDGDVRRMKEAELGIEYRTSKAKRDGWILLEVTMGPFEAGEPDHLSAEIERIKALRESKHPSWENPSAGSFFKNLPPPEEGAYRIPAGKYLDECGVKGMRVGGAQVFDKHANIIVNVDNASAADVDTLATRMADMVRERFGIELQREVQYLRSTP